MTPYVRKRLPDGHISLANPPSTEELERFYAEKYFQAQPSSTYQAVYDAEELQHKCLKAEALLHAAGGLWPLPEGRRIRLLEAGCGEGFVLAAAQERGMEATGLDFSEFGVQRFNPAVRDNLIVGDAITSMERLADQNQTYDICILQNVLEHVIDPERMLRTLKALLAPGGRAAITVPNDFSHLQGSIMQRGLADHEYWWAPPQHLHYFNTTNLPVFLRDNGLNTIDLFSDFPIEFYLLHSGSNYARNPVLGKEAHRARVTLELLMAETGGLDGYLDLGRSLARCGMGRDITALVTL